MRTHKAVPVSMSDDMLTMVNARAKSLGLSRSGYIQQLMRADLGMLATTIKHEPETLRETGTSYGTQSPQTPPDKKPRNAIARHCERTSFYAVTRQK